MPARVSVDASSASSIIGFRQKTETAVERAMRESGKHLEKKVKDAVRTKMKVRTGSTLKAIGHESDATSTEVGGIKPVDGEILAHLPVQEFGGTITGKPYLAIPLSFGRAVKILTRAGVGGIRARDVKANPQQFGLASTFVNDGIIFGKLGNTKSGRARRKTISGGGVSVRTNVIPLFALVRSVTIRAKGFLIPTVQSELSAVRGFLDNQIDQVLEAA